MAHEPSVARARRFVARHVWVGLVALFGASVFGSACGATTGSTAVSTAAARPDWYAVKLTDVRTGQTFSMNDFNGRVVLIETIAQWCPNCLFQQSNTRKFRTALGNPDNLVLVSLDVDSHEDESSLKDYAEQFGFDWYFAVAPLEVQRAMGNLYSAQYLNPPLEPMLLIDSQGNAFTLPYGEKEPDTLRRMIEPYVRTPGR